MAKKRSILDYFPYDTYREGQEEILRAVEAHRNDAEIILIVAPTGCGKASLKYAMAQYFGDVIATSPTNALVQQEMRDYPDFNYLFGKDHYPGGAGEQRRVKKGFRRGQPIFCNPYVFLSHKLFRNTLIMDEGHRLVDLNRDLQSVRLWQHDIGYGTNVSTVEEIISILESKGNRKYEKTLTKLQSNDYYIERGMNDYRKTGSLKDAITLYPFTPQLHEMFQNKYIKRIILMSATLSIEDLHDMGIGRGRKILRLEIPSSIPVDRRKFIRQYVGKLNNKNLTEMADEIVDKILEIASNYENTRGFVHVTYNLARILKGKVGRDSRFMFHTPDNAKGRLKVWLTSPVSEGKIFIGAGFSEGINLAGDEFKWQAIAKVPFPSLVDPLIREKANRNPAWFYWRALRELMQMYGRISRGPVDSGDTYILDEMFELLDSRCVKFGLIPKWFKEVL